MKRTDSTFLYGFIIGFLLAIALALTPPVRNWVAQVFKKSATTFQIQKKEICNNGIDDNGDGKIDGTDPQCLADEVQVDVDAKLDKSGQSVH